MSLPLDPSRKPRLQTLLFQTQRVPLHLGAVRAPRAAAQRPAPGRGVPVTLQDYHWPALYREPMTRDFVGFFVQSVTVLVVSTRGLRVGLRVVLRGALHDAHWPALYREPMTRDFVGFSAQSVTVLVVWTLASGARAAHRHAVLPPVGGALLLGGGVYSLHGVHSLDSRL